MANTPVFLGTQKNVKFQITSTMVASTNPTAYTAGTNGSRVYSLFATSNASSAITAQIAVSTGGTPSYLLGTFAPSTTAGQSTSALPINIMSQVPNLSVDSDGNLYIPLVSGDLLQVIPGSSIASGTVNIFGNAADF